MADLIGKELDILQAKNKTFKVADKELIIYPLYFRDYEQATGMLDEIARNQMDFLQASRFFVCCPEEDKQKYKDAKKIKGTAILTSCFDFVKFITHNQDFTQEWFDANFNSLVFQQLMKVIIDMNLLIELVGVSPFGLVLTKEQQNSGGQNS